MKRKLAAWIVLGLIAIVSAACLGTTNEITKDVIAEQNKAAAEDAWRALVPGAEFPDAESLAEGAKEYVLAGMIGGNPAGYVAQVAVSGYGGEVQIIVGTDPEGVLNGIKVGGANFQETAGLGAKAKEPAFTNQFAGKNVPLVIGEDIDAITAATITSSAVVRGVNMAVENIAKVAGFSIKSTAEGGALGDGRYAATTRGFAGPVYVEIKLDDTGVISEITIGDDAFCETAGYGQKALEPAFYEQFIGKSGHLTLGVDIDAISGATITSTAVADAVNMAMLFAADPDAAAALALSSQEEFVPPEIPEDALTSKGAGEGFHGDVEAVIYVDSAMEKLLMVEIGGDKWAETEGFGSRALEPAFWSQFIGMTLPIDSKDVDMLAGATVTSWGAIDAINNAYKKLLKAAESGGTQPAVTEPPAEGVLSASKEGFEGPVYVEITVDDAGAIASLKVGNEKFKETPGLGAKAKEEAFTAQFVGKIPPIILEDIDVISGATITSKAVVDAVNEAYGKLPAQQ